MLQLLQLGSHFLLLIFTNVFALRAHRLIRLDVITGYRFF